METQSISTIIDDHESVNIATVQFASELEKTFESATRSEQRNAVRKFLAGCAGSHFDLRPLDTRIKLNLLRLFTNFGMVITVSHANERDLEPNDFKGVDEDTLLSFQCLGLIMNTIEVDSRVKKASVAVLILCAQHLESNLWTTPEVNAAAKDTLDLLLKSLNCSSINELLNKSDDESFRKSLFSRYPTCLSLDGWKLHPGMKAAFIWCLTHMKYPNVGDVLNEVLPVSLIFVDDFVVENRTCGLDCLFHIMENSPTASMQWYGRSDVIYNAIRKLVYTREPEIIRSLYPCLFRVLQIMLPDPKKPVQIRKISNYDLIYQDFLLGMESEQIIALRSAYSLHLSAFIAVMGITILRHLPSTLKVILQYLEMYDGPEEITRLNSLNALKKLISVAWPRIPQHLSLIVKGILKLMHDIPALPSKENAKESVTLECIECLKLLRDLAPTEITLLCESIDEVTHEIPQLLQIKQVLLK